LRTCRSCQAAAFLKAFRSFQSGAAALLRPDGDWFRQLLRIALRKNTVSRLLRQIVGQVNGLFNDR
jgi:hypothetical protein